MAKVINNPLTEGLSGKIAKHLVFRQMRNGSTVLCTAPDFSNRVFSERQLTHQSRFQQAAAYAKVAAKTTSLYIEMAARTQQPAYNIALSDWFHPPVIHKVTRLPGRIQVTATDNVRVSSVHVTIADDQGIALEQGEAAEKNDSLWEYETSSLGHITVQARDLAGNVTVHDDYRGITVDIDL